MRVEAEIVRVERIDYESPTFAGFRMYPYRRAVLDDREPRMLTRALGQCLQDWYAILQKFAGRELSQAEITDFVRQPIAVGLHVLLDEAQCLKTVEDAKREILVDVQTPADFGDGQAVARIGEHFDDTHRPLDGDQRISSMRMVFGRVWAGSSRLSGCRSFVDGGDSVCCVF